MALLLFDIDGTLLRPAGLGRRAFEAAVRDLYGEPSATAFLYDGLLDTQIARRTLGLLGVSATDERVDALLSSYLAHLAASPAPDAEGLRCPGVSRVLEEAAERGHHAALLTGNLREGAQIKLAFAGLTRHFQENGPESPLLGAFARDAAERWELVAVALDRCRRAFSRPFRRGEIWVVGDSARDVEAARRAGVRCAAVATGLAPFEALRALSPDLLLADLQDPEPLWRAVERGGGP